MILSLLLLLLAQGTLPGAAPPPEEQDSLLRAEIGNWFRARIAGDPEALRAARTALVRELGIPAHRPGTPILAQVPRWQRILEEGRPYPRHGGGEWLRFPGEDREKEDWLRIPEVYAPERSAVPLLVVIPGASHSAEEVLRALPPETPPEAALLVPDLRGLPDPALDPAARRELLHALAHAFRELRVDRDRLLLVGWGSAAATATYLAAILPHFFSAVSWTGAEAHAELPAENLALYAEAAAADFPSAVRWVFARAPRNPNPLHFSAQLLSPGAGRVYWVQALRFDPMGTTAEPARIAVQVDRESNTISIQGRHVDAVELFLNDAIVDLDRPLVLIRNGHSIRFRARRSLRTVLENFALNLDPRAFYSAAVRDLDLPPPTTP